MIAVGPLDVELAIQRRGWTSEGCYTQDDFWGECAVCVVVYTGPQGMRMLRARTWDVVLAMVEKVA